VKQYKLSSSERDINDVISIEDEKDDNCDMAVEGLLLVSYCA